MIEASERTRENSARHPEHLTDDHDDDLLAGLPESCRASRAHATLDRYTLKDEAMANLLGPMQDRV
jgi:hypothetical protein